MQLVILVVHVCVFVTTVSAAKTPEPIEMLFFFGEGGNSCVWPGDPCIRYGTHGRHLAGSRHALTGLTLRSKGQMSRSRCYENRHVYTCQNSRNMGPLRISIVHALRRQQQLSVLLCSAFNLIRLFSLLFQPFFRRPVLLFLQHRPAFYASPCQLCIFEIIFQLWCIFLFIT